MFQNRKAITTENPVLPINECLAKTYPSSFDGAKLPGRVVLNHCRIVGEVARELLRRTPTWLVEALFPQGSELIAASHDIGKVSPTFQEKIYQGTTGYVHHSKPGLEKAEPELEKSWGGHAGVSQATAEYLKLGRFIPEILGQHHGYSPNLGARMATDPSFGGKAWQQLREQLISELKAALQTDYPKVTHSLQARVLAGFTSVADWIGSGSLFDDPAQDWQPRIRQVLDLAGFLQPILKPELDFTEVFPFPANDTQQAFIGQVQGQGVYVLEAPMGLGKTEAALYAAYRMMASNQATGLYFALPTQLTSDKIHKRVEDFLGKILDTDSPHQQPTLLHGNAWLKTELGKEGNPGGSWFQASKRGILAPFAVGTIDQALMAVMNVKHGFVRTFGLAGKVVILDEVHTYDSYTGTILDELVKALRDLHCTVIILSATLTHERRGVLTGVPSANPSYPLISAYPRLGETQECTSPLTDYSVNLELCLDESKAIEEALKRAEQGEQVLWIENTVAEAQQRYLLMAARSAAMGVECGLLHSRFLKCDREAHEKDWTKIYGKEGAQSRKLMGRILIGTQVLEQSLDIDADFLITRFAPSDMLLQRIGRLWRHETTQRPPTAQRQVCLLAPNLEEAIANPELAFGKTAKVYSPYVLCRSLEVWQNLQQISIPSQIREIIESTYQFRAETGKLREYLQVLENEREKLQRMALIGLSKAGKTLPEEKASTRYSEQYTQEVLLLRSYRLDHQKKGAEVTFLDGTKHFLPNQGHGLSPQQKRTLAAQLIRNTVRVADYLAPKPIVGSGLDWLKGYLYLGKSEQGENRLRVAKVRDSGEVIGLDDGEVSEKYSICYDQYLGYQADK